MKKLKYITFLLIISVIVNIHSFWGMHYSDENSKNEDLRMSVQDITLITPENKSFTTPMNGYYLATYGFENDEVGTNPKGWAIWEGSGNAHIDIDESIGGHRKMVKMTDIGGVKRG